MRVLILAILVASHTFAQSIRLDFERFRTEEIPEFIKAARFDAQHQASKSSRLMDGYIDFITEYTADFAKTSVSPPEDGSRPLSFAFREIRRLNILLTLSLKLRERIEMLYSHVDRFGNSRSPDRTFEAYTKAYSTIAQISRDLETIVVDLEKKFSSELAAIEAKKPKA